MGRRVVRTDDSLETPVMHENACEQGALAGVDAVHQVVAAHDRHEMSALHRRLERGQVHLAQRAGVGVRTRVVPAVLLIVQDEVLGLRGHPLTLNPVDVADAERRGQVRILGEVFGCPPAHRGAVQVQPRPIEHVDAAASRLTTEELAIAGGQSRVEGGAEGLLGRQRCGGTPAGGRHRVAQADRAVGEDQRRRSSAVGCPVCSRPACSPSGASRRSSARLFPAASWRAPAPRPVRPAKVGRSSMPAPRPAPAQRTKRRTPELTARRPSASQGRGSGAKACCVGITRHRYVPRPSAADRPKNFAELHPFASGSGSPERSRQASVISSRSRRLPTRSRRSMTSGKPP